MSSVTPFPQSAGGRVQTALATFGVAFVARPLGAVLFGHLGDRVGRRTALVATVALMGVATCGIGLCCSSALLAVFGVQRSLALI